MIDVRPAADDGNGRAFGTDGEAVLFAPEPDPGIGARQWFHIAAEGAAGVLALAGLGGTAYPAGWEGLRIVARPEGGGWRRIDTWRQGDTLRFRHAGGRAQYALTVPHGAAELDALLARLAAAGTVERGTLLHTAGGHAVPMLRAGRGARRVWVLARQHGGEPPAGWCAAGFLGRLADPGDAAAVRLREVATLQVLPLVNPDGARAGFLRATLAGVDPNRCWMAPGRCAEVAAVQAAMAEAPPDLVIDIHTDFELPFPYVDPADGRGSGAARRAAVRAGFEAALAAATPDFQTARRYPYAVPPDPGAQAQQCAGWVAEALGAPAITLELPASDYDARPDPAAGWSPQRSMALGAALVPAMLAMLA